MNEALTIIGRSTYATFPEESSSLRVPVKIDTGADSSSIWASHLSMLPDGTLQFVLFDEDTPFYSGHVYETRQYSASRVRSSNGTSQIRYKVTLSICLADHVIQGAFTLADRSRNIYPVLVGCSLLKDRFLVDVSQEIDMSKRIRRKRRKLTLTEELERNPQAFFEKYHADNPRGDI